MQKIKFHSDYIDQIPNQLQTNNMVSLYEFLYDLQTKNRPQHFKKHATHNGVVVDRINRLGFLIVDSYTLAPLTTDEGAARIFFSTDGDYKQICLKYDTEQKTIDNPYEIETKILFQRMNQIGYQALEFTKEDDNLNVFFYIIMVNPEIAHDFDVFDLDIPYESKDASHLNNTFYKVL